MRINFTPDSSRDIGSGYEKAWQAGRVDLAALTATDLRYGFFEYPVDLTVEGHAFLSASRPPLIDIMFTLGHSLHGLRTDGSASIDFTENTYMIHLERTREQVLFSASHGAATPRPSCSFAAFTSEVRSFITKGLAYLEPRYPALARNPAMSELRVLAGTGMVEVEKLGRIASGDEQGRYVYVKELPDEPPSYLVLTAADPDLKADGGDEWVEDFSSLEQFFGEGRWLVEWNL
ncbi:hypothetical protein [Streptomyces sp. NPDC051684]|uniref:hypothetical protein n=1 Tax=Streptomyces sp. NPDC051684 TaxID=3365670 RepID=UPI003799DF85